MAEARLPIATPGMRIGLFGGSFNPPHEGHRLVALQCLERLALDRVWLLVSPGNPLKDKSELLSLEERLALTIKLMDDPRLDVTGFEADRGFTFTYQTVEFLTRAHRDTHFVWIMGADSLETFDRWERWQEIAALLPMAVYARPGVGFDATRSPAAVALAAARIPEAEAATLATRPPPAWVFLHGLTSDLSSTAIREALKSSQ